MQYYLAAHILLTCVITVIFTITTVASLTVDKKRAFSLWAHDVLGTGSNTLLTIVTLVLWVAYLYLALKAGLSKPADIMLFTLLPVLARMQFTILSNRLRLFKY